jgi:hypothetical protein
MYPWPTGEFDNAMDVALDIAMNYLDRTGQAVMFKQAQWKAAGNNGGLERRHAAQSSWPTPPSRLWNGERRRFWKIKSAADDEISGHQHILVKALSAASGDGRRWLMPPDDQAKQQSNLMRWPQPRRRLTGRHRESGATDGSSFNYVLATEQISVLNYFCLK